MFCTTFILAVFAVADLFDDTVKLAAGTAVVLQGVVASELNVASASDAHVRSDASSNAQAAALLESRQYLLGRMHQQESADVVEDKPLPMITHVPPVLYPVAAAILLVVVLALYGPRGPRVVIGVVAYLASLSTMMISVKWVFVICSFRYPRFLTVVHFLTGAAVAALILVFRAKQGGPAFPVPSAEQFWKMVFPVALAMALSIGANNMALVYSSVAFTEIVASTNCLITYAMVIALGMPFQSVLIWPLLIVASGAMISISGEINFSLLGMVLALVASFFRALRSALQQKLLMGRQAEEQLDPCGLLFWVCVPSAVVMQLGSMLSEGFEPYHQLATTPAGTLNGLIIAILVSCVNATVLNLAHLFVTQDLGAVGVQLTSQAKSVLTVLGSMVVFGDPMSWREIGGFIFVLGGIFLFTRLDQKSKEEAKEEAAEKDAKKEKDLENSPVPPSRRRR